MWILLCCGVFFLLNILYFRISTRQALRGPFGELLMEEMAKPSSLKSIQPAQLPALVSVGSAALCTVTTYTSEVPSHTTLAQVQSIPSICFKIMRMLTAGQFSYKQK